MNWIKNTLSSMGEADWTVFGLVCVGAVVCMFVLFGTCEKEEPKPDRTQVISNTIVDVVKSISEAEARKAEAEARARELTKGR